jgi:hypothetical protein
MNINNEFEDIWEQSDVTYYKLHFRKFSLEVEENKESG